MNQSYSILRTNSSQLFSRSNSHQNPERGGRKRTSSQSSISKIFGKQPTQRPFTSFNEISYEKSSLDLNRLASSQSESPQRPKIRAVTMTETQDDSPGHSKYRPTSLGFLINKSAKLSQNFNSFYKTKTSLGTQIFRVPYATNKPNINEKIALSKLLQDMPIKITQRLHSSQKKNVLPFERQSTKKFAKQTFYSAEKWSNEKLPGEEFSPLRMDNHVSLAGRMKPISKRGKSDSGIIRYSKSKPSILDYLTGGERRIQTQDSQHLFSIDKSYSRIQQATKQISQEQKPNKQNQLVKKFAPRFTSIGDDAFVEFIPGKNKNNQEANGLMHRPDEIGKKFQADDDGVDAEDRAADDLAKVLVKYPFDRVILRLNRQATIGFQFDKKRKIMRAAKEKAKFAEVRKQLKDVLKTIKNLKLTLGELQKNTVFSLEPFEKENSRHFLRAAGFGDYQRLEELLKMNRYLLFDFNNVHQTALHLAILNNHTSCCELLIKHGADLHATDTIGRTPLYLAIEKDNIDVVRMLLFARCSPWSTEETDYRPVLEENPVAAYYISRCRRVA